MYAILLIISKEKGVLKTITEINSSEKAKRKIKTISDNVNLDFDFIKYVFSFYWNYDEAEPCWVNTTEIKKDAEYNKRVAFILDQLYNLKMGIDKSEAINCIFEKINRTDKKLLEELFIFGAKNKNYCFISEYASFYYLSNATKEKLQTLGWGEKKLTDEDIILNIFLKIFRGGSIERANLKYLYSDLVVKLPYKDSEIDCENWIPNFIKVVEKKSGVALTGLLQELRFFCKGDKYFLQTVLESLSYSGILKVNGIQIENVFIPDYKDELSSHFYSNDWSYPLRFWNKNRG